MKKEYIIHSPSQTKKLGEILAKKTFPPGANPPWAGKTQPQNRAFIVGLEGSLGGGKTTFLQGFARGLGIKEKILSPTFVILKKFQVSSSKFQDFYHIDCYRIKKPKELLDLGFKEIISDPKNIVAIEWADRIRDIMPKDAIWLKFDFINKKTRKISIMC